MVNAKVGKGMPGHIGADLAAAVQWAVGKNGGGNNTYTPPARLRPEYTEPKKARDADVAGSRWLWADLDPDKQDKGKPFAERRAACLARLTTELPADVPAPSAIVDSGGGYWGLWQLDEEVEAARLKPMLEWLERRLGGDSVSDPSRIMRLPGTVNWPDEGKRAAGQVPALAKFVTQTGVRHPVSAFGTEGGEHVPAAPAAVAWDNLPRFESPSAIPRLSDRIRAVVANGDDDDKPYKSRSEAVFAVMCEMVRAGYTDSEIAGVVTDPSFEVSAHFYDPKGRKLRPDERRMTAKVRKAVQGQIGRARARVAADGDGDGGGGLILTGGEYDWAIAFRRESPNLIHHLGEFLDWDGAAYVVLSDAAVRARAWAWLHSRKRQKDPDTAPVPFTPTAKQVGGFMDALKGLTFRDLTPPCWLDGRAGPDPLELVPTRSGLLHLPTGELMPATPALFTRNALDFAYDPAAPEPERWIRFLGEVWPDDDDPDCITTLQEFMGYLLTPDTRLQKAAMMVGPPASGKGTILKMMMHLVGVGNTTSPTMNSLSSSRFGMAPLLNKTLMTVSDMRIGPRTDLAALEENLLRIAGEDLISTDRKNRDAVEVRLTVRMAIATNELPRFADVSGAIARRMITLTQRQSFRDNPDTELEEKLTRELPGILNWAMEGWRRVQANKKIKEPQSSRDAARDLVDLASPVPEFVDACCVLGSGFEVDKVELFSAFRSWFHDRFGDEWRSGDVHFFRALGNLQIGVKPKRGQREGERVPMVTGIRLNDWWSKGRIGGRAV
ncbi:phage/plasmid primase, P4 family [Roseinatronobacter sp. NSM]|uniref:phage/plasmid primase, P4 family n=1 Tax=Roseinatronobacter sp. NSM TaxID=3457785 RepID=UPI004036552D